MEPITRKETFLAKAAGQNVETPEPITRVEHFLKNLIDHISQIGSGGGGGGGSESVQSDWNQNDPAASDYVKNRTHYEESVSSRNTVYETTVDNTSGKLTYSILDYDIAPLKNRNVIVTVNGVEYESVCTFNGGSGTYSIALGDGVHYITQHVTDDGASITKLEATIYEIKIETVETSEAIVPLDEKFIPDTIARVNDVTTMINEALGAIENGSY